MVPHCGAALFAGALQVELQSLPHVPGSEYHMGEGCQLGVVLEMNGPVATLALPSHDDGCRVKAQYSLAARSLIAVAHCMNTLVSVIVAAAWYGARW